MRIAGTVLLLWVISAGAQIRTVTRTVKQFGDLERQLANAEVSGDRKGASALVADDFEVRLCERPAQPVPRSQWLDQNVQARHMGDLHFEQEAVKMMDTTALYSAQVEMAPGENGTAKSRLFLADAWSHQGDQWKLVERYQCAVPEPAPSASGFKKKY